MEKTIKEVAGNDLMKELMERVIKAEVEIEKQKLSSQFNEETEAYGEFYNALARAQANFGQPKKTMTAKVKTKSGGTYDYKYATLSDILAATEPALNAEGIFFSQHPRMVPFTTGVTVTVVTELLYKNGLKMSHESHPLNYNPDDKQGTRSTISYLRRCSACDILGVEAESDDDAQISQDDYVNQNNHSFNDYGNHNLSNVNRGQSIQTPKKNTTVEKTATSSPNVKTASVETSVASATDTTSNIPSNTEPKDNGFQEVKRSQEEVFKLGLERAKQLGASEELIEDWRLMTIQQAIREMSHFVRTAMQNMSTNQEQTNVSADGE